MQHYVETFAYGEVDCSISLDGKKSAHGFGKKLGYVNIYGHKTPPTFRERQQNYENKQGLIAALEKELIDVLDSDSNLHSLPTKTVASIKEKRLCTIQVGSQTIRDIREIL